MAVCILSVQIHEASDLRNVAWMGFNQDPYVVVRALPSNTEVRTAHVWGGGTKPKWDPSKHNSRLLMKMNSNDHTLVFEIRNKNNVLADELIATAILDMGMITEGTDTTSSPIPLPLTTGGVNGGGILVTTVYKKMTSDDEDLQRALMISANGGGGGESDFSSLFSSSTSTSSSTTSYDRSTSGGKGHTLGGDSAPLSADERRAAAAAAAESRQSNWRQGGSSDPIKQAALNERRIKDDLMGKIEAIYKARGGDAPFGLGASSIETLQKHLKGLTQTSEEDSKRQKKEDILAAKMGLKN